MKPCTIDRLVSFGIEYLVYGRGFRGWSADRETFDSAQRWGGGSRRGSQDSQGGAERRWDGNNRWDNQGGNRWDGRSRDANRDGFR